MTLPLEQLVHIPVGQARIEGGWCYRRSTSGWCCLPMAAAATARATTSWPRCCTRAAWAPCCLSCLRPEKAKNIVPASISLCRRSDCARQRAGLASAGAAAAGPGQDIWAVVSCGGRPDLASAEVLARVPCPTLLLVGSRDEEVLELNRQAASHMRCPHCPSAASGATHLFDEPGTLEAVARQAADWVEQYLKLAVHH